MTEKPDLDDNLETTSSDVSENLDDNVEDLASSEAEDNGATSSDAQEENDDDLLDVVRSAAEPEGKGEEEASETSTETPEDGADEGEAEEQDGGEDDDYADVPFNQHPRFQHLIRTRDKLKKDLEAANTDAQQYRNIENFLQTNNLSGQEAADGFEIMALMKANPQEAWKRLQPIMQDLLVAAGEVLPNDLRQRVQTGEISQEAAVEISRQRARATTLETQTQAQKEQWQRQQQEQAQAAIRDTISNWEQNRRLRDPNFGEKFDRLQREVAYLQRTEGMPSTPKGVEDQLNRAYRSIAPAAKPAAQPTPQAKRPVVGGQAASATAQPQPASVLDVIKQHAG